MSEKFQRPDKSFFQNPKELGDLINKENLVHKFLPKQTDSLQNFRCNSEESIKRHSFACRS